MSPRTLPLARAVTRLLSRTRGAGVSVVALDGGVSVRVHRPVERTRPGAALLWVHGGGYVLGCAAQDDRICRRFARDLGVVVAAVDYRLAPEHPFPLPLEDCYAALSWLAEQPEVDRRRIAVAGASAGGGLAAGLALLARDRGEIAPVLQLLVYPMLDDRTATRADPRPRVRRLWNARANRFGWRAYLGHEPGAGDVSAHAAPARAASLDGAAPAWIGVGSNDLFHEEDVAYARRLAEAGVPCRLEVVPGAFHGFDVVVPGASVSKRFGASQVEALRAAYGG